MEDYDRTAKVISISLPAYMIKAIKRRAYLMNISTSAYVKNIIAKAITGGKENGRQEEGSADARD